MKYTGAEISCPLLGSVSKEATDKDIDLLCVKRKQVQLSAVENNNQ